MRLWYSESVEDLGWALGGVGGRGWETAVEGLLGRTVGLLRVRKQRPPVVSLATHGLWREHKERERGERTEGVQCGTVPWQPVFCTWLHHPIVL